MNPDEYFESMVRYMWRRTFGEEPESSGRRAVQKVTELSLPAVLECELQTSHFKMDAYTMIHEFQDDIIRQAHEHHIDGRAIAIAISWEYYKNLRGRYSDYLQSAAKSIGLSSSSDGIGWGSMHGKEAKGLRPWASDKQLMCMRLQAKPAIKLIAEFMAKMQSIMFQETGGVWINNSPEALCAFYQAGEPLVRKSAAKQKPYVDQGAPFVHLDVSAMPMAVWGRKKMGAFVEFNTVPMPPPGIVRVEASTVPLPEPVHFDNPLEPGFSPN